MPTNQTNPGQGQVKDFLLGHILPNPYQPRSFREPTSTLKLAVSIAANSLIQPPTGRPYGDHIQLAVGMGRLAAHCMISVIMGRLEREQTPLLSEFGITEQTEDITQDFETLVALCSARLENDGVLTSMPVIVRDLTDKQMFEFAVSENHDREPLPAVDLARSMKTYMEQFGATSAEVGALYHLSGSAIRGLVRLLSLPPAVLDRLNDGSLSRGQAGKLLALQAIAPDLVERTAAEIKAEQPVYSVDQVIANAIAKEKTTVMMWEGYRKDSQQLAGQNLWVLSDYTPAEIRPVNPKALLKRYPNFSKILGEIDDSRKPVEALEICLDWLGSALGENEADPEETAKTFAALYDCRPYPDFVETLVASVRPPVCEKCMFHRVLNSTHYCTNKPCWDWKKEHFTQDEAAKVSERMGIPLYTPEDGNFVAYQYPGWGKRADGTPGMLASPFDHWVDERNAELRIRAEYSATKDGKTDSHHCQMVGIGSLVDKYPKFIAARDAERNQTRVEHTQVETNQPQVSTPIKAALPIEQVAARFLWDHLDWFIPAFQKIPDGVIWLLQNLIQTEDFIAGADYPAPGDLAEEPAETLRRIYCHRSLMHWLASDEFYGFNGNLNYIAELIKENLAEQLQISLPPDFVQIARQYQENLESANSND